MNTDTIAILVAVLGVGLALWRAIERLNSRIDAMEGRLNSRIDSVNARIDALYQALFSRKDPAA